MHPAPRSFLVSLLALWISIDESSCQQVAFNTSGAALTAFSPYTQTAGSTCPASSTVNGRLDGGLIGGPVVDFWAAWPWNQSQPTDILWTFVGGARTVT